MDQCSSCKRSIMNDRGNISISCPKCAKTTLIRCSLCRKNATKYTCHQCGFTGPN